MQTVLITGGAGFIGSHLVRRVLADTPWSVVNLDLLTYAGNLDSLADFADDPRHRFVRGDIGDRALVARLLAEHRPHAVLHLAAESHADRSIDAPHAFVATNVVGTVELLSATLEHWRGLPADERAAFRFVHVSTDEVFGSLGPTGRFTASSAYAPNSPYSASKAAADHFVRAFHRTYGLPVLTTNSTNNYGPYQFPEKLVPLMILNALEGRPLPVYGDGHHVRDWLFVEDHCRALLRVLEAGVIGGSYLIGGDDERPNLEVVHAVCDGVDRLRGRDGSRALVTFVPDRPGHDERYAVDSAPIRDELGWHPTVPFAEGLARTIAWYATNPAWVEGVTTGVYRRERLGLAHGD